LTVHVEFAVEVGRHPAHRRLDPRVRLRAHPEPPVLGFLFVIVRDGLDRSAEDRRIEDLGSDLFCLGFP
jgi:hypothetical protein